LIAAGLVLILVLDFDVVVRGVACCAWFVSGRLELARIAQGFESCAAIRISPGGEFAVLDDDQEWQPGALQAGSMVLRNFAWLRLKTANGAMIVEPLRGCARENPEWRRLQVIWRHIGAE